jgi:hypothetical protein
MIQDKAQFAVNGCSLNKDWTKSRRFRRRSIESFVGLPSGAARSRHLRCRLRAPTLGASFGKDQPFPARRALQLTTSRHAESTINFDAVH